MSESFADTSYFLALLNPDDRHHRSAVLISEDPHLKIVTTDLVVVEVGNFLSKSNTRHLFAFFLKNMLAQPRIRMISSSPELIRKACDLHVSRTDKSWSVTDGSSFVLMEEQKLSDVLTSDVHFRQAGFNSLLHPIP